MDMWEAVKDLDRRCCEAESAQSDAASDIEDIAAEVPDIDTDGLLDL